MASKYLKYRRAVIRKGMLKFYVCVPEVHGTFYLEKSNNEWFIRSLFINEKKYDSYKSYVDVKRARTAALKAFINNTNVGYIEVK